MQDKNRSAGSGRNAGKKSDTAALVDFLLSDTGDAPAPRQKTDAAEGVDRVVARFMERAKPIIAQERGWNDRAYRQLQHLAEELQLSDQQREAAIGRLHQGEETPAGGGSSNRTVPLRKRFRERAVEVLGRADHESFNFSEERDLIQYGVNECGLSRDEAAAVARSVREELGVAFLSQTDAVLQVRHNFADAYREQRELPKQQYEEIAEQGLRLGLSRRQIDEIARECAASHDQQSLKRQEFRRGLVVTAIVAGLTMAALFAVASLLRRDSLGKVEPAPPPSAYQSPNDWFDARLMLDVNDAKRDIPALAALLRKVETGQENERSEAYRELFGRAVGDSSTGGAATSPPRLLNLSPEQRDQMADVVAGIMAREPSPARSRQLADYVADLIDVREDEELTQPASYAVCDWAARTLLLAQVRHNARPGAEMLAQEQLAAALTIDPSLFDAEAEPERRKVVDAVELELVRLHFRSLRRLAADAPDKLAETYGQVLPDARSAALGADERQALQTLMLCEYIERVSPADTAWTDWNTLLLDLIGTADQTRLQKFDASCENCGNGGLKRHVTALVNARENNL